MSFRLISLGIGVGLLWATAASAQVFDYAKIVDTNTAIPIVGGTFSSGFNILTINAYNVSFSGGGANNYSGIFMSSSNGAITRIADTTMPIPNGMGVFSSFDSGSVSGGQVAFVGNGPLSQQGIYESTPGGLIRIADKTTAAPEGGAVFNAFTLPSFNNGDVAFEGNETTGRYGIYSTVGGLHLVANNATTMPGGSSNFINFSPPSLSAGNVAFTGNDVTGTQYGVFDDVGGSLHAVANQSTPAPEGVGNLPFTNVTSISNGNVAFNTSSGVYTDLGGTLNIVANASTPVPGGTGTFGNTFGNVSMDNGNVVFVGGLGIYADIGGTLAPVVVSRKTLLDGRTASVLPTNLTPQAISNGNIVFSVGLSDGTSAIYVAEENYDYVANASGSWDTATNWSFGLKPRSLLNVNIHPDNGALITGPAASTTVAALDLGANLSGQAELRLQPTGQLNVSQFLTVEALGKLNVNGGVATANFGISNYGEIDLGSGGQISGGAVYNYGILHGNGSVGGEVLNYGQIQAINTQMEFTGPAYNYVSGAQINVRNSIVQFTGGLTNYGNLNFSFGTSDVFGNINNVAADPVNMIPGGQIIVSGNSNVTFYNNIVHNGDVFRVSAGSTAVFFGAVSGAGAFTGGGNILFEGTYSPGNSPASVTLSNDVTLDSTATLKIELGGTTVGTQYDKVSVGGNLQLGGALNVSLINGFIPVAGDTFDILDWNSLGGTFDTVNLPTLNGRIVWNSSQLYTNGSLAIVATFLAGDFNRDGHVDAADILALEKALVNLPKYEAAQSLNAAQLLLVGDVNGDGRITNADLSALENDLQNGGGSSNLVPEPNGFVLAGLAFAAAGSFSWRRRQPLI
jgi:hypothetical protein